MSEDYYFCQAARREGIRVWADLELSMELEHFGTEGHKIPVRAQNVNVSR